ncbi:hypothetical protein AAC387_Pa08g0498 [Persea americana]
MMVSDSSLSAEYYGHMSDMKCLKKIEQTAMHCIRVSISAPPSPLADRLVSQFMVPLLLWSIYKLLPTFI